LAARDDGRRRRVRQVRDGQLSGLGGLLDPESDRDTVLAIVGGVVGAVAEVPAKWVAAREPLPA